MLSAEHEARLFSQGEPDEPCGCRYDARPVQDSADLPREVALTNGFGSDGVDRPLPSTSSSIALTYSRTMSTRWIQRKPLAPGAETTAHEQAKRQRHQPESEGVARQNDGRPHEDDAEASASAARAAASHSTQTEARKVWPGRELSSTISSPESPA